MPLKSFRFHVLQLPESWAASWTHMETLFLSGNVLTGTAHGHCQNDLLCLMKLRLLSDAAACMARLLSQKLLMWRAILQLLNVFTRVKGCMQCSSRHSSSQLTNMWRAATLGPMLCFGSSILAVFPAGTIPELWASGWPSLLTGPNGTRNCTGLVVGGNTLSGTIPPSFARWVSFQLFQAWGNAPL